ncbi:MAG TPA: DNA polymerase III subunit delta [Cryomorphaceae bacterium]|nr:DNA polymerase III subunit delta [Cryomorphaceae bacterium]
MDFNKAFESIKKGNYKPIYIFDGEEPYFIDVLTDQIEKNALSADEKEFNQSVLYGSDISPDELLPIVKRFPMMAPYQVVIVKEAQNWRSLEALNPIIENPVPTTILVLSFKGKKVDGRSSALKLAKKNGLHFRSDKLRDYQLVQWMGKYCKSAGISIDAKAAEMLKENIGEDLGKIVQALDKLQILTEKGEMITADSVSKHIGISKDFNIFELQRAIGARNDYKAKLIANYFAGNQKDHHIIPTLYSLSSYFKKLIRYHGQTKPTDDQTLAKVLGVSPYFVREYHNAAANYPPHCIANVVEVLYETDLKSKGVNSTGIDSGELLKEMVSKLLIA